MVTTVKCAGCDATLNEDPNLREGERKPCPVCGSTARRFHVEAHARGTTVSMATASPEVIIGSTPSISPLSELLLQAVIVPGDRTAEGRLIAAVAIPWFDIIELLQKDPKIAFQITPEKWEEIVAGAYRKS